MKTVFPVFSKKLPFMSFCNFPCKIEFESFIRMLCLKKVRRIPNILIDRFRQLLGNGYVYIYIIIFIEWYRYFIIWGKIVA